MSADEFQTKYASVMEGMLKSAVAETTKLFETMVDELKAEITRIKKENDDLKTRCSQFESSKNQQPVCSRNTESPPRSSGCSEKRDTAVQCDLVPVRTMLVERCPTLGQSSLQSEQQQWSNEQMQNGLWDHNYVTQGSPQLAFILVKQEERFYDNDSLRSVLKQEEDECAVSCGQVSNTGLPQTTVFEAEKEGPLMNQDNSTGEMAQNHQEALELPSLGTVRDLHGAENQSTEPEHSSVLSLATSTAHMENASEGQLVSSEEQSLVTAQQQPVVKPLDKEQLSVISLQCQRESEISVNEPSDVTSNKQFPDFNSPKEAEQLAEPTPQNKEVACEGLETDMEEDESNSHPTRRRRGRPPKKGKQIEQQVKQSSSVQERENTSIEDMENSNIFSLPVSVASLTKGCSFQMQKTCESQQLSKEMEASPCEVSFAKESPNCPPTESQEASVQLRARRTSATIQDAMLLVDAMDQSSGENTYCSPKRMAASPSTYCSPCVGILQTADKAPILTETPKTPDHLPVKELPTTHLTIPALSSSPRVLNSTSTNEGQAIIIVSKGHQTVTPLSIATSMSSPAPSTKASAQSKQQIAHLLIPSVATCKPSNPIHHKIIVAQRSKLSVKSHEGAAQSQFQIPTLVSRFVDVSLPVEKPSFSSGSQKTRYVISRKLLPVVPLKSTTSSKDQQLRILPHSEISIINPRQVSTEPSMTHPSQTTFLENLESVKPADAVTVSQLISSSQELHVSVDAQTTAFTANNVKSPIETASVSKTTNTHTETDSSLKNSSTSVLTGEVPASMSPKDQDLSPVVRLTRLPFSISTKESVSVSTLLLNGCPANRSSLRDDTAQQKLSNVVTSEPLAKPVVSISMCYSLNETSPSAAITISQSSTPPKTPSGLKKPSLAASMTEHPADERADCTPSNDSSTEEKQTEQTSLTSKDTSDPHLQMSKTQFLAQLAVSPQVEAPAQASPNNFADTRASTAENGACDKKWLEQTSLVARLRSHLKTHFQSKQTETNPQRSPKKTQNVAGPKNTKSTLESLKKTSLTSDDTGHQQTRSTSVSPKRTSLTREGASLKKLETSAIIPGTSSLGENVGLTMSTNKSDSVFTQHSSSSLQFKTESSPLSPRSRTMSIATKGESGSPNTKVPILAKHGASPRRTGESTPAKKPKLIQDATRVKKNFRLLNAKKIAIAPKVKTIAMKLSRLQTEANTSQLSQDQTSCEAGKKYKVKSVWIPPIMPNTEAQSVRGTRSSMVIVKKWPKSPRSQNPPVNCLPVAPIQATSGKTPTVASPLQPLSVIGGRLLKNQCGECGRILSSTAALESHVNLHTGLRPFSCTSCGKSFPDSKGLKRHGRVHRNGRIHTCQKCGKGFVYRFGLNKHLQMVHSRIKPFVCQICSKGFYTKRDVETHIRIHTGEKPFHCHLCEKKFTRRVELNVHLRWHKGEKRHWCPYCGKGFLDFNNLKRHKYIHTGEKPHSCPHCPKHFTQSGHLKKHLKNVHKSP